MRLKDDAIPPRFSSAWDRAAYLLAQYRMGVYLALGAVVLLVVSGRWEVPELPQPAREFLIAFAMGVVPSMVVTKIAVVDRFIPDPRERVLEWVPDDDGNTLSLSIWKVPTDTWQDREHDESQPVIEPDGVIDSVVTRFEWDESLDKVRVRGCNPEIADPADLQSTKGKLDSVYNELLEREQQYTNLKSTLKLKQHKMESEVINALVAAVEYGVAFEPTSQIVEDDEFEEYEENTRTDAVPDPLERSEDGAEPRAATDGGNQK